MSQLEELEPNLATRIAKLKADSILKVYVTMHRYGTRIVRIARFPNRQIALIVLLLTLTISNASIMNVHV